MTDEPKLAWLNWLAITTIIFSACATLSAFKGSSFSTKSVLSQTGAANMWAYFQSKSIKQHDYELQLERLKLDVMTMCCEQADSCRSLIDLAKSEIARYDKEKQEAEAQARNLELKKADYQTHSAAFGLAVVFLQVAIMFSGLAALLKKKYVWVLGVIVGGIGVGWFLAALIQVAG